LRKTQSYDTSASGIAEASKEKNGIIDRRRKND